MKLCDRRPSNPYRWFAWYPVLTEDAEWVWLETVWWWREAYPRGLGTNHYRRMN